MNYWLILNMHNNFKKKLTNNNNKQEKFLCGINIYHNWQKENYNNTMLINYNTKDLVLKV